MKKQLLANKNFKMNKSQLRDLVRESVKELMNEQTTSQQCADITSQNYGNTGYFFTCCEMGYFGNPPGTPNANNPFNINDASCKQYLNYGVSTYGLTPQEVSNCCDPDWGIGELDCENPEWIAQNPNAAGKCWVCRDEGQNCVMLNQIPMAASVALANGFGLYNDMATCNANEDCGPSVRGGDRCSDPVGSYDINNTSASDYNPDWGLGCWFCHPEFGGPGNSCQTVNVPMDQHQAYIGYTAGTTSLYTTNANCMADPITKCSDDDRTITEMISCECCDENSPGNAISMAQQVASSADCIGAENTIYAGLGVYGCNVSPVSGGPGTKCKKQPKPVPTNNSPVS